MKCAENVANIYMAEMERRRSEGNYLLLTPRKGTAIGRTADLSPLEDAKAQEVLRAWGTFHGKAGHRTYADFYSKLFYCQNITDLSVSPDTFLELIADREFLFLEYSESYTPPDYPPLSHLVKSFDAEVKNYPEEKRNMVLDQAFVPTQEHYQDYLTWQRNLKNLKEAHDQRIHHLAILPEIPNPFSVEIHGCAEKDVTDLEKFLGALFCCYLQAFQTAGGVLNGRPTEDPHTILNVIHSVREYLLNCSNKIPGTSAIVFFHLFTQKKQKMFNGSLKKYNFEPLPMRKDAKNSPRKSQAKTQNSIRLNILLYDQLLELFTRYEVPDLSKEEKEQYLADAKFFFYRYSRFDRYCHYDLTNFWVGNVPDIRFTYIENYRDGVDYFGNLLRFHINYCMPNQAQWLVPVLDPGQSARNLPLAILTTFLLAEASAGVPAKERLSNRVSALVKADRLMLEKYKKDYFDEDSKRRDLQEWVRDHDLHIPREEAFLYENGEQSAVVKNCGQYVLEFFLRDRMISEAKETLYKTAKEFFNGLCLGEFSHGDYSFDD